MPDTPIASRPLLGPGREKTNQDTTLVPIAAGSHLDHLHIARIRKLSPIIFQKKQSEETYQQISLVSVSAKMTIFWLFFFFSFNLHFSFVVFNSTSSIIK